MFKGDDAFAQELRSDHEKFTRAEIRDIERAITQAILTKNPEILRKRLIALSPRMKPAEIEQALESFRQAYGI